MFSEKVFFFYADFDGKNPAADKKKTFEKREKKNKKNPWTNRIGLIC